MTSYQTIATCENGFYNTSYSLRGVSYAILTLRNSCSVGYFTDNNQHTYCPVQKHSKVLYDLEFSQRLSIIKSSRATSRIKWLNREKTNVSSTISVLVLRVLPSVEDFIIPQYYY
jgi:hypothetical protein